MCCQIFQLTIAEVNAVYVHTSKERMMIIPCIYLVTKETQSILDLIGTLLGRQGSSINFRPSCHAKCSYVTKFV